MSEEQKTLKSCYILDRLREWFELYGNQNHQRAEEELHLAIDELYEYQQKDRQIADLESKLAESEKQGQHLKDWLDNEILTSVDSESYYATINEYEEEVKKLKQQLADSIRPKFPRQEHICGFAFGEIREYIVVAYLDNNITLCENIETNELEWCDNNFLVRTFEEAQTKLQQMKGNNYE